MNNTYPAPQHPDPILRGFPSRDLLGDSRNAELNRPPLIEAKDVPTRFGLDPRTVALGDFVVGVTLPTQEIVAEAYDEPEKRAARLKNATVYVFDDGPTTGRHAAKDQPRYTIMSPLALPQIAADAETGYVPRHAAAPGGYKGSHRGRPRHTANAVHARKNVALAPQFESSEHRVPIAQLAPGETLAVGKHHWLPTAGLDVVQNDATLQDHYQRTGRHQGDFEVDAAGKFTYHDRGSNPSVLFYRTRTPGEQAALARQQQAAQERRASMGRGRAALEAERAERGVRPSPPPYADAYIGEESPDDLRPLSRTH